MDASFSAWISWSRRSRSCCASFQTSRAEVPPRISALTGLCLAIMKATNGSPLSHRCLDGRQELLLIHRLDEIVKNALAHELRRHLGIRETRQYQNGD